MHHIQRKILSRLMYAESLGYAQLRPAGVESNHFAYHLEQLLREGLLTKDGRAYSLSAQGLALADRVSHESMEVRVQPHIVTSIYITNEAGQILLYRHAFQPYTGCYGPPQGRLHYDEHITDAATRELLEKTGLGGIALQHRGMAYVHATKSGKDISKMLMHVFSGTVTGTPALREPTAKGGASWVSVASLPTLQRMPGFVEIQALLSTTKGLFFTEIESELFS